MNALSKSRIEYIIDVIQATLVLAVLANLLNTLYQRKALLIPLQKITEEASRFAIENNTTGKKLTDVIHQFGGEFVVSRVMKGEEIVVEDVAASFQKAVTDVLVDHAMSAVKEFGFQKLAIAGGVASNSALRAAMKAACKKNGVEFYYPSPILCTDNAAMIGAAAYYDYKKGARSDLSLNAVPNLKLGER